MFFKIFVSSNQNEFQKERDLIKNEIEKDTVLNNLFNVYTFERTPASPYSPEELYSEEVLNSDIYIGLIGSNYGSILDSGLSPTETEYELFKSKSNQIYIYVKNTDSRDEKTEKFLKKIREKHTYRKFNNEEELIDEIKKSLMNFLQDILKESKLPFDIRLINNSSSADIDNDAYNMFFESLTNDSIKQLKNTRKPEEVLEIIGAGESEKGIFKLNNTGALFFAKDIEKFNIDYEIKMVCFNSKDRDNIVDMKISKKPILKLLKEVHSFFKLNTREKFIIQGFNRINIPDYPYDAIREAIVNAIVHRDYTIKNTFISLYIYSDRIEITSPGKLIPPVTLKKLGTCLPAHRNKTLCDILSQTKFMEHVGTGIKRMNDAMINNGLSKPIYEEDETTFKVIFKKASKINENYNYPSEDIESLDSYNFNERQIKVLTLIVNNKEVMTVKRYSNLFDVSRQTASRDLNQLLKTDLINKIKNSKEYLYIAKDID